MKSFNKWMVVPFEEKIVSSEDKYLTNLKDILTDKTLDDSKKYNNFNTIFKSFVDKKSTIPEKKEIVNPKKSIEASDENYYKSEIEKLNKIVEQLLKNKDSEAIINNNVYSDEHIDNEIDIDQTNDLIARTSSVPNVRSDMNSSMNRPVALSTRALKLKRKLIKDTTQNSVEKKKAKKIYKSIKELSKELGNLPLQLGNKATKNNINWETYIS